MTTLLRRRPNPASDMLGWLDSESPAEMPGIDPEKDLDISIDGDVLTISGECRDEKKDRHRQEFHHGSFSRSVTLPRHLKDGEVKAEYADGVLTLRVPFDGPVVGPRCSLARALCVRVTE